jgi:predicted  nucleic acid-binding Zn-ribbon protein
MRWFVAVALSGLVAFSNFAAAQSGSTSVEALQAEIARLKEQLAKLEAQLAELQKQQKATEKVTQRFEPITLRRLHPNALRARQFATDRCERLGA